MEEPIALQRPRGVEWLATFYLACVLLFSLGGWSAFTFRAIGTAGTGLQTTLGIATWHLFLGLVVVTPIVLGIDAYGLWYGKRWARIGVSALCVANIIFVWYVFVFNALFYYSYYASASMLDSVLQLAILYYILTPKVKAFLKH